MHSLQLDLPTVPSIEIWLASPEQIHPEPKSPFAGLKSPAPDPDDCFRSSLLSPPPQYAPLAHSPLRPSRISGGIGGGTGKSIGGGKGLAQEEFEALMRATREKSTAATKRAVDLRKEVAIKAHQNKQAERRALFLSKVQALPTPSATCTPPTPPESPAIFHYTLPSPGLISPLAVFQGLNENSKRDIRVEQVNFFSVPAEDAEQSPPASPAWPEYGQTHTTVATVLPSLDQISARLKGLEKGQGVKVTTMPAQKPRRSIPLPAFLQNRRSVSAPAAVPTAATTTGANVATAGATGAITTTAAAAEPEVTKVATTTQIGRLTLPIRKRPSAKNTSSTNTTTTTAATTGNLTNGNLDATIPVEMAAPQPRICMPPLSPVSPVLPKLQMTTTVITPSPSRMQSPTELTESNLALLNMREVKASRMLSAVRRRVAVTKSNQYMHMRSASTHGADEFAEFAEGDMGERLRYAEFISAKGKRFSAPPELPQRERSGFSHPVLKMPGGF